MKVYLKASIVTAIVGVAIVMLFMAWKEKTQSSAGVERLSLIDGMEANGVPNIKGKTIDGKDFDLQDLKGKVVIINFWASWCGPCLEEFPSLITLVKKMAGKVVLVAVSEDNTKEEIDTFLKAFPEIKNSNIYVIHDDTREFGRSYNADRLPESFITGPDLKLKKKIVGTIDWNTPNAVEYLSGLENQ